MSLIHEADLPVSALKLGNKERPMSNHKPSEPKPSDFKETAQRSQDANIADESAAYQNASPTEDGAEEKDSEAHPS